MTQMPGYFDAPLSDVASYNTQEVCIAHIVEYANEMLLCLDRISDISDLDSSLENFSAWAEFIDFFAQFHVASFELAPARDRVPNTLNTVEKYPPTIEYLKVQLHAVVSASMQQLITRIREDEIGESMDRLYTLIDLFDENFYDTLNEQFAITGKGWATLKHEIDVHLMRYLCKDRDRWTRDHCETADPKIDTRANPLRGGEGCKEE